MSKIVEVLLIMINFLIKHPIHEWIIQLIRGILLKELANGIIVYHIYLTPPLRQDMTQGQFLTGLNSEFSFS